ncbi:glycosyltransferase family 4 protein [Roseiterribacter gracilis]|uniref:glycosyltransferase family 4 protein n=1 Tax=Roseiterribacter gracilis TaxID=2812848 RepID=UPI003B4286C9
MSAQPSLVLRRPNGRPITILQVLPSLVAGGAERGALDVAAAIVQAGGRALVASAGGPMVRELERSGATHLTLPLKSKNPLVIRANAGRLARLMRTHEVDIIHARSRAPAWSAWRAAARTNTPFMTTFHAAYGFKGEWKRRYNSIMARGERVIAISDFLADHIRTYYGVDPAKLVVVPRGIDLAKFDPAKVGGERVAKLGPAWRVPEDMKVVLLPARRTRLKGHLVLLEALARLGRDDLCAVLVGGGAKEGSNYERDLERAAANVKRGLVRIVDQCDDMPAAYSFASVVVAPSLVPEGFGRVPVEAQAMGRPVIATDLGGFRETILNGETGLLIPPNDAKALAEAIDEILAIDPTTREAVAIAARDHITARFTKERMTWTTLGVYLDLLGLLDTQLAAQSQE